MLDSEPVVWEDDRGEHNSIEVCFRCGPHTLWLSHDSTVDAVDAVMAHLLYEDTHRPWVQGVPAVLYFEYDRAEDIEDLDRFLARFSRAAAAVLFSPSVICLEGVPKR